MSILAHPVANEETVIEGEDEALHPKEVSPPPEDTLVNSVLNYTSGVLSTALLMARSVMPVD